MSRKKQPPIQFKKHLTLLLSPTLHAYSASAEWNWDSLNRIPKGASGSGKTYIACALGNAACRKFRAVRYVRMPELLDEPAIARSENQQRKVTRTYAKVDLLILDEWLLRCLSIQESYDLLEIIEARSRHGATIFCIQYDTDRWYNRIIANPEQDSPVADVIMDRIVHYADVISIEGKISMRERHGLASFETT